MSSLVFYVLKNNPAFNKHQIQKIKKDKESRFYCFPQKYFSHHLHPMFVQNGIDPASKSKIITLRNLSQEQLDHYVKDGKFVFNDHVLELGTYYFYLRVQNLCIKCLINFLKLFFNRIRSIRSC